MHSLSPLESLSTLTVIAVSRPALIGKRWRVNGFARYAGGGHVFRTCAIPQRSECLSASLADLSASCRIFRRAGLWPREFGPRVLGGGCGGRFNEGGAGWLSAEFVVVEGRA